MKKLNTASFVFASSANNEVVHVKRLFEAFCAPFPSLEAIPIVWRAIWDVLFQVARWGQEPSVEDWGRVQEALAFCSCGGEWPGSIRIEDKDVLIIPYCGDRILRLHLQGEEVEATADYSRRPSFSAASEVISLAERSGGFLSWVGEDPPPPPRIGNVGEAMMEAFNRQR